MVPNAWSCLRCFHRGVWCKGRKGRAGLAGCFVIRGCRSTPGVAPSSTQGLTGQFFSLPCWYSLHFLAAPVPAILWWAVFGLLRPSPLSVPSPDVPIFTPRDCLLLLGSGYHDAHRWAFAVVLEVHDTLALRVKVLLFSLFYFILLYWKLSEWSNGKYSYIYFQAYKWSSWLISSGYYLLGCLFLSFLWISNCWSLYCGLCSAETLINVLVSWAT